MKHVKTLALAAVAAGALIAFIGAGTASAAVICSTTTGNNPCPAGQKWPAGTVIDFSLPAGQSLLLVDTSGNTLKTCKTSTIKGTIEKAGGGGETVTGPITEWTLGTCTFPTTTLVLGKFEIKRIAGTSNGTVIADGTFKWTTNSPLLGSCNYGVTTGTSLGDLTEGNPAIFHLNAVLEEKAPLRVSCPDTAKWTATYTLTSPSGTTASISDE